MCYDPIGQGERSQILKEDGTPKHGSTTEHSLVGVGAILLGINTAQYRTYDGIRGIDYLVSRPDIDAKRIGCTGCSGGGTLTSLLGKSLLGIRTENVAICARFLSAYMAEDTPRRVHAVGIGEAGVAVLLHAAALEPDLCETVVIRQSIASWEEVVRTPEARNQLVNVVHGALKHYDLPDLVGIAKAVVE